MAMVTKLVRVVTCHKELPLVNSHDLSMRWSCEVICEIKCILSRFTEDP